MSIKVNDFKWEKGKNDLEYIALLKNNLDAMLDKFKECSKIAREQYFKGYEKGKKEAISKFAEWFKESDYYLCYSDTIEDVISSYENEQKNG